MLDLPVTWIAGDGKAKGLLQFNDHGVTVVIGKQQSGYPWDQIHRVTLDDPGRTKASVGAIAAFGVVGLARRIAYTLITVSGSGQDIFFETKQPVSISRTFAYRVLHEIPAAAGRIFVDGVQLSSEPARSLTPPAAWYPDPHDIQRLRWFDGNEWTEHYSPRADQ